MLEAKKLSSGAIVCNDALQKLASDGPQQVLTELLGFWFTLH